MFLSATELLWAEMTFVLFSASELLWAEMTFVLFSASELLWAGMTSVLLSAIELLLLSALRRKSHDAVVVCRRRPRRPVAATIVESGWIGTQGRVGSCLCRPCTTIQLVDKDQHTHTHTHTRGKEIAVGPER